LIELGKEAFADTDYGLAAQRFRQAGVVLPTDSRAQFLLAQALFALGKYREAADAISAGLTLEPNWPALNFHPLELYGANAVLYPDHLRRLEDVVVRFPKDSVVLFLYAYELWFDGRKDEARVLLLQAQGAGADPAMIDLFLRALPPVGGL
jgi:tetratricopeptide (TPR) repeat protein